LLLGTAAGICVAQAPSAASSFGPTNPFYAASSLAFHAPSFDKIKDSDYQPAIDAGMAQQLKEVDAIANNPAPPTFDNTFVALEKSGQLFNRAWNAFNLVSQANTDPELEKVQDYEAPRTAALADAINLNSKLFARIKSI
jgi:peptidyl-dipeptidase Dcp